MGFVKRRGDEEEVLRELQMEAFEKQEVSPSMSKTSKDFVEFLSNNDRAVEFLVGFFYERIPEENKKEDKIQSIMDYLK